jgi:hypothetical protein
VASNFLRDLVISVLHRLRQSRTLHTLTFGPISGVHFTLKPRAREGRYDGPQAGERSALCSILQNTFDGWMTYLGQRLRPINDYCPQLPRSSPDVRRAESSLGGGTSPNLGRGCAQEPT